MHKFAFAKRFIKKDKKINLSHIRLFRSTSSKRGLTLKLDFYKNKKIFFRKKHKKKPTNFFKYGFLKNEKNFLAKNKIGIFILSRYNSKD